jgi:hypothetical protein
MDSDTKQMLHNLAIITETRDQFIEKMNELFLSQISQNIETIDRVHLFINALFFLMFTKYDWVKNESFTHTVQEKNDELIQCVNRKYPELKNIAEEIQDLYNRRLGIYKCEAITLKQLKCKRFIIPSTSVFTHFCVQHKKLVKHKFAMIILSLSNVTIKDLSSTIARVVIELMKK